MHDGSKLYLKKVAEDYDPTDKLTALAAAARDCPPRRVRHRRPLRRAGQGRLHLAARPGRRAARQPAARARASGQGGARRGHGVAAVMRCQAPARQRMSRCRVPVPGRARRGAARPRASVRSRSTTSTTSARCATRSDRPTASGSPIPSPAPISDTDKNDTDIWMVSWDGRQQHPAHLDARQRVAPALEPRRQVHLVHVVAPGRRSVAQVWLLNRAGGEAVKLTDVKGGVSDYAWSPDSKRLVLVVNDPDPKAPTPDAKSEGCAAKTAEADRRRSLLLQGRQRRLSARRAHPPLSVRRRREEVGDPDAGSVRRNVARLVARRQADRVHPPPW